MLMLSRRPGESIVLTLPDGRRITVAVTGVGSRDKVRLGIDAPADVTVHRTEIQAIVDREGRRPRGGAA